MKSGPLPIQASAVVLAVGGTVLIVGGAAVATRQHAPLGRVLEGIGLLVVTALTILATAPAVAATNVPHARLGPGPETVGLAATDVTPTTDDGVSLAAWYVPSVSPDHGRFSRPACCRCVMSEGGRRR